MDVVDVPNQIRKAFTYSGRTWRGFFLSLGISSFILTLSFDLVYNFLYVRIHNTEHPRYDSFYWVAMVSIAVILPGATGAVFLIKRLRQSRPFGKDQFGIAIAPFEINSINADLIATVSKATVLQALDEVMHQFFISVQNLFGNEDWASDFEFRFLPPNLRVRQKREAAGRIESLHCTMLIWGSVVQESNRISVVIRVTAPQAGTDLAISGNLDPQLSVPLLKLLSLEAAASVLESIADYARAERLLALALEPAREIDKISKGQEVNHMASITQAQLDRVRSKMGKSAPPSAPGATAGGAAPAKES